MKPFSTPWLLALGLLAGHATHAQTASHSRPTTLESKAALADTVAPGRRPVVPAPAGSPAPPTASGASQPTDRRLTTNIRDLGYGLPQVLKMHPVTYNWKRQPRTSRQVGFIAQELEQVVPEAVVAPQAADEYYGLKYEELIPVLTKAIQEQQQQIETLKAVNGRLYAKLECLNALVRQLRPDSAQ